MTRKEVPVRGLAVLDQLKAEVTDLTGRVRRHQSGCDYPPGACPGEAIIAYSRVTALLSPVHAANLLAAALLILDERDQQIAELRAHLAGRPTP